MASTSRPPSTVSTTSPSAKPTPRNQFQLQLPDLIHHTVDSILDDTKVQLQLRPTSMLEHVRIGLKPELQLQIVGQIRRTLHRQAYTSISELERLHQHQCRKPAVVGVHRLDQPSNAGTDVNSNLYHRLWTLTEDTAVDSMKDYGGEVGFYNHVRRLMRHISGKSVTASDNVATASVQTIGADLWRIDRCGKAVDYEIRYKSEGDVYESKLVPLAGGSVWDVVKLTFKNKFGAG